jgi:prominin 1
MTLSVDIVREINFAGSGAIVQRQLAEVSRAVVLSNLTSLVRGLESIKSDLQDIHMTTKNLQDSSNNLARSK